MSGAPNRLDGAIRDGLFFVVGNHRGGTTLLQSMLNTHPAITVPPETQYFQEVWPKRETLGDLATPAGREQAIAFLGSVDCTIRALKLDPAAIAAELPETGADYADLLVALLTAWARPRQKTRVGDKSPGHIHCVPEMARCFPKARFIASLRDPRGVVSSELGAVWGARSVDQIGRRWRRVIDEHRELERSLPPHRYMMLRYEDLVTDPESTLRGVCEFLGEDFDPAMLRYYERPGSELGFDPSESWKLNTLRPLDPGRLEAWREKLSPIQIALIERAAGEHLEGLGYTRAAPALGAAALLLARLRDRVPWALEVISGAAVRKRGPRRSRDSDAVGGSEP